MTDHDYIAKMLGWTLNKGSLYMNWKTHHDKLIPTWRHLPFETDIALQHDILLNLNSRGYSYNLRSDIRNQVGTKYIMEIIDTNNPFDGNRVIVSYGDKPEECMYKGILDFSKKYCKAFNK